MAFDFPNNPTDGQTVLHDNGKYYKWDATAGIWNVDVGKRIQDFIDSLVDAAPGTLDTLNELAAAINDDPDFVTTMTTANTTLQTNIDTLTAAALAARTAIQDDVDANEAAALAGRNAIQADVDANEAAALAARTAIQADVDQNEVDSDAGIASNLALLNAQRALEWDAVFATHGSLYATTTTVG